MFNRQPQVLVDFTDGCSSFWIDRNVRECVKPLIMDLGPSQLW